MWSRSTPAKPTEAGTSTQRPVLAAGVLALAIGAYLVGLWGLPDPVFDAVLSHHEPSRSSDRTLSPLAAVHVANALDHGSCMNYPRDPGPDLDIGFLEAAGLSKRFPDQFEELMSQIHVIAQAIGRGVTEPLQPVATS